MLFEFEKKNKSSQDEEERSNFKDITYRQVLIRYGIAAAIVVVIAFRLPFLGLHMSEQMGWSHSFVGTLFIALTTSLPELVVTVTAVRMGALDLAIGNALGSNLFNMASLSQ